MARYRCFNLSLNLYKSKLSTIYSIQSINHSQLLSNHFPKHTLFAHRSSTLSNSKSTVPSSSPPSSSPSNSSFYQNTATIPTSAWILGTSGVIPFLTTSACVLLTKLEILNPQYHQLSLNAHIAYSASILSFLGAVHWGIVLKSPNISKRTQTSIPFQQFHTTFLFISILNNLLTNTLHYFLILFCVFHSLFIPHLVHMFLRLSWSVTPSLIAWISQLSVLQPIESVTLLTGGILTTFVIDQISLRNNVPSWYLKLRVPLTLFASSSLFTVGCTLYFL